MQDGGEKSDLDRNETMQSFFSQDSSKRRLKNRNPFSTVKPYEAQPEIIPDEGSDEDEEDSQKTEGSGDEATTTKDDQLEKAKESIQTDATKPSSFAEKLMTNIVSEIVAPKNVGLTDEERKI